MYIFTLLNPYTESWTFAFLSNFQKNIYHSNQTCNAVNHLVAGWFGSWLVGHFFFFFYPYGENTYKKSIVLPQLLKITSENVRINVTVIMFVLADCNELCLS